MSNKMVLFPDLLIYVRVCVRLTYFLNAEFSYDVNIRVMVLKLEKYVSTESYIIKIYNENN